VKRKKGTENPEVYLHTYVNITKGGFLSVMGLGGEHRQFDSGYLPQGKNLRSKLSKRKKKRGEGRGKEDN